MVEGTFTPIVILFTRTGILDACMPIPVPNRTRHLI